MIQIKSSRANKIIKLLGLCLAGVVLTGCGDVQIKRLDDSSAVVEPGSVAKGYKSAYPFEVIFHDPETNVYAVQTDTVTKESAHEIVKELYSNAVWKEEGGAIGAIGVISIYEQSHRLEKGTLPNRDANPPEAEYIPKTNDLYLAKEDVRIPFVPPRASK
ncbi:hypothetical protein [Tumebacillus lipolyticus]|uniref:DUF3221 domain-containing protein n=1 Tax=Tumebacillus lipolyticus TaxID=1280370 RepID=A0ABW4ZTR1_9BACL